MTMAHTWRRRPAALVAVVLAGLLAACSSTDRPKPTPLEPLTPKIAGRMVWSAKVDAIGFPLRPASQGGVYTVAGGDGVVLALQADSGRELWRANVGAPIVAGVGSDGRFTSVVTRDNQVVVLEAGAVKWRQRVPSRVASAPLVAGERVFVMSVDRVVHAFDALDGRLLWRLQRPGDALTLSQAGVVSAFRDTLLVGQGPRLAGVDPLRGSVRWEVPVASPRGTNEVERLADLLGPPVRVGNQVCMRAFQSAVGCVDAERGALVWTRNTGGLEAVGGDANVIVGADATDRITAWRAATGDILWTSERFLYRQLAGFAVAGPVVVFGDQEGQVHFLSRETGEPQLRLPTDGSPVVGPPVVIDTTILVTTRKGGLFAFRPV